MFTALCLDGIDHKGKILQPYKSCHFFILFFYFILFYLFIYFIYFFFLSEIKEKQPYSP